MNYHITKVSQNEKTGPIPVTITSSDSCPPSCPFRGSGCYGESGPLALHWSATTKGLRGGSLSELVLAIASLPNGQLWRHNQAGDLPGKGERINSRELMRIAGANTGRRGFTYTHKYVRESNHKAIKEANNLGFTVNLSANSLGHADKLATLNIGPVACVLPADVSYKATTTPAGRRVVVCPATHKVNFNCSKCGICANRDRNFIIGFPAHGSGAKKASAIASE